MGASTPLAFAAAAVSIFIVAVIALLICISLSITTTYHEHLKVQQICSIHTLVIMNPFIDDRLNIRLVKLSVIEAEVAHLRYSRCAATR